MCKIVKKNLLWCWKVSIRPLSQSPMEIHLCQMPFFQSDIVYNNTKKSIQNEFRIICQKSVDDTFPFIKELTNMLDSLKMHVLPIRV